MSFFNKKEEVIDIELTQLGKYLLSKGRFKPVFYVFSDDEILYNVEYTEGSPERAREASTRIQKETQRFRINRCRSKCIDRRITNGIRNRNIYR